MNIPTDSLPAKPVSRVDSQPAAERNKTAAQQLRTGDLVELSKSLELTAQQEDLQASRVASLKSQITAGTYQVSSRLVAEKMLSGTSGI